MKNFYEAIIIKPSLRIVVHVVLRPVSQPNTISQTTHTTVTVNNSELFKGHLMHREDFGCELEIEQPLEIRVEMKDRIHPEAVEIEVIVDNNKVIPKYLHLANPATCYIDKNGIWEFSIPSFYPWHHEITGKGWIA
jgi:hypothetical protein